MDKQSLLTVYKRLRKAASERDFTPKQRLAQLAQLGDIVSHHQDELVQAVSQDYGHRHSAETAVTELGLVFKALRYTRKHLKQWTRPQRAAVNAELLPGKAWTQRVPRGLVGIISPWNYPLQLSLLPLIAAMAGGNRILLKPSELTPSTSQLLRDLLHRNFKDDHIAVLLGDADVAAAFTQLPMDHLFFTGSTRTGKKVATAAAKHLTPTTLELGGKSPVIIDHRYSLKKAAQHIVTGKWINAGQTCIAPDYVLVPQDRVEALKQQLIKLLLQRYANSNDYTAIINQAHFDRLQQWVDDAHQKGALVQPLASITGRHARQFAPTILTQVNNSMLLMQEEIFGPLLPLIGYASEQDINTWLVQHPYPLAAYIFSHNKAFQEKYLDRIKAGGYTINGTLYHCSCETLPFGGLRGSGMGSYHAKAGFNTFTHERPVLKFGRIPSPVSLFKPPFDRTVIQKLTDSVTQWKR